MQDTCPNCGVREPRLSQHQTLRELVKSWAGIYYLRCRRCRHRWKTSVWTVADWKYALCPRCYRQTLTTWSEQYYRPPLKTKVLLRIGATPYRCAACRCNFVSFLPCRERFVWKHEEHLTSDADSSGRRPEAHS